jgi:hypothetical protein
MNIVSTEFSMLDNNNKNFCCGQELQTQQALGANMRLKQWTQAGNVRSLRADATSQLRCS